MGAKAVPYGDKLPEYDSMKEFAESLRGSNSRKIKSLPSQIRDEIGELVRMNKSEEKSVVFVDDLDRCSPEVSFVLIDSMKLVIDLERFIFILGINNSMVDQALQINNGRVIDSESYLDRIAFLDFSVPSGLGSISKYIKDCLMASLAY